jgi:hypothetical protein
VNTLWCADHGLRAHMLCLYLHAANNDVGLYAMLLACSTTLDMVVTFNAVGSHSIEHNTECASASRNHANMSNRSRAVNESD